MILKTLLYSVISAALGLLMIVLTSMAFVRPHVFLGGIEEIEVDIECGKPMHENKRGCVLKNVGAITLYHGGVYGQPTTHYKTDAGVDETYGSQKGLFFCGTGRSDIDLPPYLAALHPGEYLAVDVVEYTDPYQFGIEFRTRPRGPFKKEVVWSPTYNPGF